MFFSFNTRFFITLKYLITKPGLLTTEYWLGRRTKYLPPLRLYLVMSLMYFFISSIINPGTDISLYKSDFREKHFQFELDKSSPKYDPSPEIVAPFVDFFKENEIVNIENFKEERGLLNIDATIYVEKNSQKGIVIGAQGKKLKAIGTTARKELEKMLDIKVMLRLWVKVKKDWTNDNHALNLMGYKVV